ncbi:MAG: ribonucleoside-diphosphate reductase, adenosylcobalamin-dependent [Phycisphaerae bacterium]|nr:ribonucleoside-diphosphate reductase, adenosylcobalamin-dependent [Phycisphaerae bacterium]
MKISRRFTTEGRNVYDTVEWTRRTSKITNADGSVVFETDQAEGPSSWSQLATDIIVSKYFRKAGVPQLDDEGSPVLDDTGEPVTGPEQSARQVIHRLVDCWRHWGVKHGYFSNESDADAFYDELAFMLLHQMAAPNSPQWFNTGLNQAYGISGPPQGHFIANPDSGEVTLASDAYSHPQPHACFIQSVGDDLVSDGGIMDLWTREARLFKYGSGTGTNFSMIRGEDEPLSGGGRSSGLMSFLKIGDRAAGAIKSGGTTRRAAKMVCLDIDHPDIESFINWKVREEIKVAALVEGMKHLDGDMKEMAESIGLQLDYDFNGEAYQTVSGQNSNNSVRVTDEFFDAVDKDGDWTLYQRTDGKEARTIKARDLWSQLAKAAWRCADPGIQYDSTINAWHTCPEGGRINASNPCSEYMFLDNTACNLASINLLKFYDSEAREFDVAGYEHAIGLWTIVLEISVLMASFPSEEIAKLSWKYRTLGLGYANLGAMLMQAGIPYDSEEGRAVCGCLTAILTGRSYAASALLAAEHGPFDGFKADRENMLRVMRNHRHAAYGTPRESSDYEKLHIPPVPIDHGLVKSGRVNIGNSRDLLEGAMRAWDDCIKFGEKFGYRNAQSTVIAPTGTIGLLMDCDTTGVEPDFALTKFKKLAGGGYFKIANQSLRPALKSLGYESTQIDEIIDYVMGTLNLDVMVPAEDGSPERSLKEFLLEKGYDREQLLEIENRLPTVFELGFAFSAWDMPEAILRDHGIDPDAARNSMDFNGLKVLGLSSNQIDLLNTAVCGTQTIEGAPHLAKEHLPVFDCANRCGPLGTRFIDPEGHIRMMAAAQPFISGAISKTINLPAEASVDDIDSAYRLSWELGLKANALYRDGCKLSQPLNTTAEDSEDEDEQDEEVAALAEQVETIMEIEATASSAVRTENDQPQYIERIVEKIIERPMRRRLPDTRESLTHKFNVAGHEGYLIVGLYEDGTPGELFITMAKEGSTIGGLMDSLGTAISVALQYGVPIESLVTKFAHQRFEPMGMTTNKDIPFAKSLVDYIFRWLGMQFIDGYKELNAPKRPSTGSEQGKVDSGNPVIRTSTTTDTNRVQEGHTCTDSQAGSDKDEPSRADGSSRPDSTGTDSSARCCDSRESKTRISQEVMSTIHSTSGSTEKIAASADSSSEPVAQILGSAAERMKSDSSQSSSEEGSGSVLNQSNAVLMGDAPACDVCGSITVRNGTCYRCLNCGNSMGCS